MTIHCCNLKKSLEKGAQITNVSGFTNFRFNVRMYDFYSHITMALRLHAMNTEEILSFPQFLFLRSSPKPTSVSFEQG